MYDVASGKIGSTLLSESIQHLSESYPHIDQIPNEKVLKIGRKLAEYAITTNKNNYKSKIVVLRIGAANTFAIEGLMQYVNPNQKTLPEKQIIDLKNIGHKVTEGIYVTGTLAG